jgi:hypothetical protein
MLARSPGMPNGRVTFGFHTISHQQLSFLTKKEVVAEDQRDFINYLKSALKNCGYKNGLTTIIGTATRRNSHYFMKRLPANSHDDLQFYRAKIEGGYNWLHAFQYLKKKLGEKLGHHL